jgi:acetyl-CoA C-acetyltransferase
VLGEATPLSGIDDSEITPPSALAAHDAFAEAGVGPGDLDVVECQDTDAARELLAYQELDLCAPGEQAKFLAEPSVVVNPSGGLLSKGHPVGATGVGQIYEIVHQLRCTHPNQVKGARVGMTHNLGGTGVACSVSILRRSDA